MNNKGVKIFIAIMISFLIFPISLKAKTISNSDSTSSCSNAVNKCKNEVGIDIKVSGYDFDSTTTSTSIGERKITITTGDNNAEYKAMMIIAEEGKIDEIELDEKKYNNKNISDLRDELAEIEDATIKTKNFTKKLEWNLNPGHEAMVVVWLKSKYTSTTCCKNSNGTCTEYLQCKAGNFTVNGENNKTKGIKEITTTGTSAFIYVQNPSKSALPTNVKKDKEICNNTWKGFYLDKNGGTNENNKYNIDSSEQGKWQSELYQKFLSYCTQPSVAFNLSDSTIRKISNNMLKIYYYQKKLKNSGAKSIDIINREINTIKANISNKYCSGNVGNCSNIITNVSDLSNRSLSCNYKDVNNVNNLQEEYLYIKEENPISTKTLSDGKSYNVCNVKCYEHLTVIYSPPQVVKAGLCFNYKITIKSETECGVDDESGQVISGLNKKEMCNPIPICESDGAKTQAGPSEKFDKCINSCDGGKYTQSCINKCYSKIYKNNKSKKQYAVTKNKTDNTSIKDMINNNMAINSVKIKNSEKCNEEDACFKYYYNSSKVASNCTKNKIIGYVHNNKDSELEKCAKYFMEAKLSNTMGHYVRRSAKDADYEWGQWTWSSKLKTPSMELDTMDIPNSVGRASPFYFRDLQTSIDTLKKLVVPSKDQQTGYWKKYNINDNGILRQYSSRFKCGETCYYAGCSADSATSSKEYSEDLVDDLEKIADALEQCNTSSTCDTTEKTSDFYIKVNTKKGKNSESVDTKIDGNNTVGDLNKNSTNVDGSAYNCPVSSCENQSDSTQNPTMFVPSSDSELSIGKGNGILGLCYDGKSTTPHYQTTITFPGSWINLKTGEVSYDCQNLCTYRKKDQYYCTPYNANDVNEEWAKWAIKGYDSSKYPENFSPEYNITSCLGGKLDDNGNCVKDSKGFGKYNWTVGFSCFYASYSKTVNTDDDVKCYKNDDGSDANCLPNEEKSTRLQDSYDIRVSSNKSIFPQKNGQDRLRGYNWGRQARLKSKDSTIQEKLYQTGYGVDPVEYSKAVMKQEKDEKSIYDNDPDLTITISKDQMKDLKSGSVKLDLDGTYSENEVIPGLRYYKMGTITKYVTINEGSNWNLGENSNTAKGVARHE